MNANILFNLTLIVTCLSFNGCQSWQGAAFPLPNATRVPPPGTGSYQLPSGYYNNSATTALSNDSSTNQLASANASLSPTIGRLPSADMPATNLVRSNFATNPMANSNVQFAPHNLSSSSGVSTSNFQAAPNNSNQTPIVPAAYAQPMPSGDTHSQFTAAPTAPTATSNQGAFSAQRAPLTQQASNSSYSGASASLSDATGAEVPSLQWQQFDGQ